MRVSQKALIALCIVSTFSQSGCRNPVDWGGGFPTKAGPILFISDKSGTSQLYSMDDDGSKIQQLTFDPNFQIAAAKWSPDGNSIAATRVTYRSGIGVNSLYIMNADGTGRHLLTNGRFTVQDSAYGELHYGGITGGVVWSPDSRQVAFASWLYYELVPNSDVFIMSVDSSGWRRITTQNAESVRGENLHIWAVTGWSRSEDRGDLLVGDLQYLVNPSGEGSQPADSIIIFGLDGKSTMCRTDGGGNARLSSDGQKISYPVYAGKQGIQIVDIDGTVIGFINITLDSGAGQQPIPVCWSADDTKILVDFISSAGVKVWILDLQSSETKDVTPFKNYDGWQAATSWRGR